MENRAAKVSAVTGLSLLLSILLQLISVPVCLHFWGAQRYGEWLAVFAAAQLLRTVDGGYLVFAGNRLNILYHEDRAKLAEVLASGVIGVGLLGAVQLIVLALAILFGGTNWLLGDERLAEQSSAIAALVVLVVTWVFSGSYLGLVHRLMVPTGMLYQSAWWAMAFQVLLFGALMFSAILRLDLLATSILVAAIQLLIYVASAVYVKRKLPEFFPWWGGARWTTALSDLRGSMIFTFNGLCQQGATNGLVLLIVGTLGAAAVPAFTTIRTLVNLWNTIATMLTTPLLPEIVRFHVARQGDKILEIVRTHGWIVGTALGAGILASYPFIGWVFSRWTGGALELDQMVLGSLLASVLFAGSGSLMTTYLVGVNHAGSTLTLAVVRVALTTGIAAIALPRIGLAGAAIGVLVGELTCLVLVMFGYFPSVMPGKRPGIKPTLQRSPMIVSNILIAVFLLHPGANGAVRWALYGISWIAISWASWAAWSGLGADTRHRMRLLVRRYIPTRAQ